MNNRNIALLVLTCFLGFPDLYAMDDADKVALSQQVESQFNGYVQEGSKRNLTAARELLQNFVGQISGDLCKRMADQILELYISINQTRITELLPFLVDHNVFDSTEAATWYQRLENMHASQAAFSAPSHAPACSSSGASHASSSSVRPVSFNCDVFGSAEYEKSSEETEWSSPSASVQPTPRHAPACSSSGVSSPSGTTGQNWIDSHVTSFLDIPVQLESDSAFNLKAESKNQLCHYFDRELVSPVLAQLTQNGDERDAQKFAEKLENADWQKHKTMFSTLYTSNPLYRARAEKVVRCFAEDIKLLLAATQESLRQNNLDEARETLFHAQALIFELHALFHGIAAYDDVFHQFVMVKQSYTVAANHLLLEEAKRIAATKATFAKPGVRRESEK